ncbi:MAG: TRAP transporter large permease [Oscillospiraceae bacterium]|nr:TRAP transporter large permease [Oscillospiraceae bacterium]
MAGEMFIMMALFMLIGIPIGFSIGMSATFYLVFVQNISSGLVIHRLIEGLNSFPLLALPLFILAGTLMVYGSTPRLIRLANLLLGRLPGGLGAAGAMGCSFFSAISGSANATVAAVGPVVGPEMIKQGYGRGFTASLIAATGAMGLVIPPSVIMVVYAQSSGASIGRLFVAGIVPGIVATILIIALTIFIAVRRGYKGEVEAVHSIKDVVKIVLDAILPLMMPMIILGGVFSGIFTPTEAASVAVVYSLILALFVYRELSLKELMEALAKAGTTSAMLLFIISMSSPFGWVLTTQRVPMLFANHLLSFVDSPVAIYLVVIAILIILGIFMESFALVIITTPIFAPLMASIGVDLVAFGVVVTLAIAIGAITPPLAVCIFTSCRVMNVKVDETFPDVFLWVFVLAVVMFLVAFVPQVALWLPSVLM